jgi:hypothetical protein
MKIDQAKLNVTKDGALAVLEEYESVPVDERTAHDKSMLAMARAVKDDKKVIDLVQVIRAGGADRGGRPRLAVCLANQRVCTYDRGLFSGGDGTNQNVWHLREQAEQFRTVFSGRGTSIVPIVPPRARKGKITECLTLFEADWQDVPADPALLKPIGGVYYEVLSEWDLTELERAMLSEFSTTVRREQVESPEERVRRQYSEMVAQTGAVTFGGISGTTFSVTDNTLLNSSIPTFGSSSTYTSLQGQTPASPSGFIRKIIGR